MSNDKNSEIVYRLIDFLKANKLNDMQKKTVYNIIMSLENKTEKQKIRFVMYYNLDTSQTKKNSLSSIGEYFKCSASAIRFSIVAVRGALIRLNDDRIIALKEVLEQLEKQK